MDPDSAAGLGLLLTALLFFVLVVAAEAGEVAGLQAYIKSTPDPQGSRLEILQRYSKERHLTLSSLALARTLALISITAIVAFLVLEAIGRSWAWLVLSVFITLTGLVTVQALSRILVARNPEHYSTILRPFIELVRAVFGIPARMLDLPIVAALKWWQAKHPDTASEAVEMLQLSELETTTGAIANAERDMIRGVIELEQTLVREVMVPRIDMVAVDAELPLEELAKLIIDKGYSRLPVFEGGIDNIVGVVFAREVLRYLAEESNPSSIRNLSLPPYFVPESKKVDELLTEMRHKKMSVAIVVDEYGGTAGLVTVEDVLEEIVGEIADEFDVEEDEVQWITDREVIVDAKLNMDSLNDLFGLELEKDDFDTLGGFIYDQLGKMPNTGDEIGINDSLRLRVLSMAGRRIRKVRLTRTETEIPPVSDGDQQGTS